MKGKIVLLAIMLMVAQQLSAQSKKNLDVDTRDNDMVDSSAAGGHKAAAFHKGSKTLGLCVGFGVDYDYYGSVTNVPAIALIYDQGIIDRHVGPGTIGIGGMIAYKTAYYKYDGYKASWNNYVIGIRGTYHLTMLKDKNNKFDPYAGIVLGIRIDRYHDSYYDTYGSDPYNYNSAYPVVGAFIGAKYNFTPHFGAFAELGYDISFFRIGLNGNF